MDEYTVDDIHKLIKIRDSAIEGARHSSNHREYCLHGSEYDQYSGHIAGVVARTSAELARLRAENERLNAAALAVVNEHAAHGGLRVSVFNPLIQKLRAAMAQGKV